MDTMRFTIGWIVDNAIREPLRALYMGGPSLGGYGFWESLPDEEICAMMTGVKASFWRGLEVSIAMCDRRIECKVDVFVIGVVGSVIGALLVLTVAGTACRCVLVRPIVNAIEKRRYAHCPIRDD
jgi:hypothetical protein